MYTKFNLKVGINKYQRSTHPEYIYIIYSYCSDNIILSDMMSIIRDNSYGMNEFDFNNGLKLEDGYSSYVIQMT